MSSTENAVRFDNVTKSFDNRRILDRVSFDVERGEACCIMGRSGSGKSVTLKLLLGLLKPDTGRIYVNDVQIEALESAGLVEVRKTMGFLFQYSALFDSLSVAENVAFPLRRHTGMSEAEIARCVQERLAEVGLTPGLDKCPSTCPEACGASAWLGPGGETFDSRGRAEQRPHPITTRGDRQAPDGFENIEQNHQVVVTHNIPSARRRRPAGPPA
jgi:ABC-type glutathione transport system ATPase component